MAAQWFVWKLGRQMQKAPVCAAGLQQATPAEVESGAPVLTRPLLTSQAAPTLPSGVDGPPSSSLGCPNLPLVLPHRHLWLPDFRSCCGSRCAPVLPLRGRGCGRCPSLHHPERAHLLPHLALLWAVSPFPTLSRAPWEPAKCTALWGAHFVSRKIEANRKNLSLGCPSPVLHARSYWFQNIL